ncbi:MAG: zinc ABC transporter substrate-binding protein [Clostridia bacterium]|nr:zinc ABC transporter substrate-binding protein [Clostridia bacterium]
MNKSRRILAGLLAAVFCGSFTACGTNSVASDGKLTVVATNFALYDFARAVCGDTCDVRMLLSPGSESHDFEATLADIALLAETDVFVYVGGESEEWVPDVLEAAGAADVTQVCAIDLVETYINAGTESDSGDEHSEDDGHHHEIDEHVWTSIPNAITIMEAIGEAVLKEDEWFEADNDAYISELLDVDAEIREIVDSAARDTVIFADRFPFRYFTEEYGLSYCAAFDGCSSAVEPSLSVVNTLIERVNETGSDTVFSIEFSDRKTAEAVAAETGCDILEFHSAHNVSRADFESGITYADIMRQNAENLKLALN